MHYLVITLITIDCRKFKPVKELAEHEKREIGLQEKMLLPGQSSKRSSFKRCDDDWARQLFTLLITRIGYRWGGFSTVGTVGASCSARSYC